MAITYEDALATLQSMFGEPWNRESLDYILRNQKGHMENTVDLVLRHGDKDPQILIDQLEAAGIVGPFEGSKAREVLINDEYSLEQLLTSLKEKHSQS